VDLPPTGSDESPVTVVWGDGHGPYEHGPAVEQPEWIVELVQDTETPAEW